MTHDVARLGVTHLIDKPFRPDEVVRIVNAVVGLPFRADLSPSSSDVAHRWAALVIRALEGDRDVRTVEDWARRSGVSAGTLREVCRILGIRPHDARDLARLLNALLRAHRHQTTVESMLDVSDRRTLERLLVGAGLEGQPRLLTVTAFLDRQRWIPKENAGLRALYGVFTDEAA